MAKLSTSHLKAVQAMAKSNGRMSEAAKRLNITPSALSHRIKEAESRLGAHLFVRQNKKLVLNRGGKRIYSAADSILKQLATAEYDFVRISQGITEVIRISSNSYNCYYWLTDLLRTFNTQFPTTEIEVVPDASSNPLIALKEGKIDMAFLPTNHAHSSFRSHYLFADELVAVVSKDHPLAQLMFIAPDDLCGTNYITNMAAPEEGREHELFIKNNHIRLKRIISAGFTDLIIDLVRANQGVTILTRWVVAPYLSTDELKIIPLTANSIYIDWKCFTRADTPLAEESNVIITWLKTNFGKK